ncbi:hypothetical protein [Egbenema bharatensis]|uniref:hypothetical protein n=1 Tax=Egbenema bharatensis TaxID=3463334 RepID=UPI003A87EDE8
MVLSFRLGGQDAHPTRSRQRARCPPHNGGQQARCPPHKMADSGQDAHPTRGRRKLLINCLELA